MEKILNLIIRPLETKDHNTQMTLVILTTISRQKKPGSLDPKDPKIIGPHDQRTLGSYYPKDYGDTGSPDHGMVGSYVPGGP